MNLSLQVFHPFLKTMLKTAVKNKNPLLCCQQPRRTGSALEDLNNELLLEQQSNQRKHGFILSDQKL